MTNTDWHTLKVLNYQEDVNGSKCYLLRHSYGDSGKDGPASTWWVDPSKDYAIVRHVYESRPGRISSQFDVTYQKDAEHGWVPRLWRFRRFDGNGESSSTVIARVTEYKINPALDENIFVVGFPSSVNGN
jgi:hypothetical protein